MTNKSAAHQRLILEQFTKQAVPFSQMQNHSPELLLAVSGAGPEDTVLDVACGPGLMACAFAKVARHVTGIDLTPAMIEQAKAMQKADGLTNLTWHIGDVVPLPFSDGSFTLVFIASARPVAEMTLAEWRRVMQVNLDGVFLGTKHAIRAMRSGIGGSIINVASASGIKASAGASAYCASKAAVRMFSKTAALECAAARLKIRVNVVSPGGVKTPIWQKMDF